MGMLPPYWVLPHLRASTNSTGSPMMGAGFGAKPKGFMLQILPLSHGDRITATPSACAGGAAGDIPPW